MNRGRAVSVNMLPSALDEASKRKLPNHKDLQFSPEKPANLREKYENTKGARTGWAGPASPSGKQNTIAIAGSAEASSKEPAAAMRVKYVYLIVLEAHTVVPS